MRDRAGRMFGPFVVTPLLVDHGAFDAYALLVEAGGADGACFTAAMRKPRAWRWLLDEPPRGVCAPLLEGTRLSRPAEHNTTEQGVERDLSQAVPRDDGDDACLLLGPAHRPARDPVPGREASRPRPRDSIHNRRGREPARVWPMLTAAAPSTSNDSTRSTSSARTGSFPSK